MTGQEWVAFGIVAGAVAYLAWRFWRKRGGGEGGCPSCPAQRLPQ